MSKRNLATIDSDMFTPIGRLLQQAMAHGITNDMVFGGLETGQTSLQGLCVAQTTKNCAIATRRVTQDGRVFRYSYAGARCDTFIANIFYNSIGTGAGDVGIDWSALAASSAVGATSVTMTNGAGNSAIAADALVGGLISLNISDGTNNDTQQMRRITGNTAAAAGATCVISFAEPLVRALTLNVAYGYCMPSPYSDIRANQLYQTGKVSVAGYAAGETDAGEYHWEQTWGMISCSLYGSAVGKTQYMRDVVFRYDGNLIHRGATGATGLEAQRAGFIMDNNGADNGATMIMLMLDQ